MGGQPGSPVRLGMGLILKMCLGLRPSCFMRLYSGDCGSKSTIVAFAPQQVVLNDERAEVRLFVTRSHLTSAFRKARPATARDDSISRLSLRLVWCNRPGCDSQYTCKRSTSTGTQCRRQARLIYRRESIRDRSTGHSCQLGHSCTKRATKMPVRNCSGVSHCTQP